MRNFLQLMITHYFTPLKSQLVFIFSRTFFPGEGHYICHIKKPSRLFTINRIAKFKTYEKPIPGCSNVLCYGSTLFGVSLFFPIKGLSIIRYGVKIGEISGDVIKYDIHYARYIDTF